MEELFLGQLEGFTFYHYLQFRTLPTLEQAQASLLAPPSPPSADSISESIEPSAAEVKQETVEPYVVVSAEDYLGGVADLTGELMRLAIASVGKNLSSSLQPQKEGQGEEAESFTDIDRIGRLVREIKGGELTILLFNEV